MALFREVKPQVSFPALEEAVLERWREGDVFRRSLAQRAGAPEYTIYEGPPTANGRPGVHHVEARVFKDIYPRYRTMRGSLVPRKGGWDCHGLPVELEIEKELGISSKPEIEAYGVERFNARCRESVQRYVADWERLTERIGYWIDLGDAYWTMTNSYVESVWWSLKEIYDRGLLQEDHKVVPFCPRCGTALSDHEVALGYETVTDPSVFVRFPLADEPGTSLLVWTTTPWTLLSNAAAAIHPEVPYVAVRHGEERLVLAEPLVHRVLGPEAEVVEHLDAGALEGRSYTPPFSFASTDKRAWYVVAAEFVTTDDGTGIVHIAPAYGAEDLEVGRAFDLPVIHLVDEAGKVTQEAGPFAGRFFKDVDAAIIEDLRARGVLLRDETIEHTYPLCWRCRTPLLYFARTAWHIRTRSRQGDLIENNEAISWFPDHIKHGRFGDWLANNVDWALSRSRYWGSPLPIWRCAERHTACVGSVEELSRRAARPLDDLDLHRPAVDDVVFACEECGGEMRRVPDVIDTWYDSGAMPFAQWHYPFENKEIFERRFPADYIAEAIDQTRGWFYSLLAESTLLFGEACYRNVVCLGHLVDQDGRKMSKSLGNILDPWSLIENQGADAVRWYMFTVGSPWSSRRIGPALVEEVVRSFMLTLWNTYSFYVLYANADGIDPTGIDAPVEGRPELDRWALAELHDTVRAVTAGLEAYDCTSGGRRIAQLVDDLSNWYVRRSRRRFWRAADPADQRAAHRTLYECLRTLSLLLAPYTPFLADELWSNLAGAVDLAAPDSVHLADWPDADEALVDEPLRASMAAARRAVALGLKARTEARLKVRQPLARAVVVGEDAAAVARHAAIVADELNVKAVDAGTEVPGGEGWIVAAEGGLTVALDVRIDDALRGEGWAREVVRGVQNLRKRAGLSVSDRIHLRVEVGDTAWDALSPHREWIAGEVLAVSLERGPGDGAQGTADVTLDGERATVSLRRA